MTLLMKRLAVLICIFAMLAQHALMSTANAALFGAFGIKDEKEMGRKFEIMVRSQLPIVEDPEVSQYIQSVVNRIAAKLPPQPFPFKASVVLNNTMNAFAVPGGQVFVLTGLLMELDSEAELAAVLSHEIAHVTQRHVASRIEKAQYMSLGSLLLAIAGVALGGGGAAAIGAMGAGQAAMLNYSRIDENEADHQGFQYLIAAKYPPNGMVNGFKKIRQKSWMSGSSVPAYLSSHPDLGDRISAIEARIQSLPQKLRNPVFDNSRFLRVKTLLWARYGDQQAALQMFSQNDTALNLMGKGILFSRCHDIAKARDYFAKAESRAEQDGLIYRECGVFQYFRGDLNRAEALLKKALSIDARDYMAQFFLARIMSDTGRANEAIQQFRKILVYLPNDSEVHEYYAHALQQNANSFEAHLHLAYSALYANNVRKTELYRARAKALAKNSVEKLKFVDFEKEYQERKEIWESR